MDLVDADVIKSVPNNQALKKLLNHERNKLVINTKGAYYYRNRDGKYQILTGLLPRLRQSFFPDINIFNLLRVPKSLDRPRKKTKHRVPKKQKGSKGMHYGKLRGTVVHNELEDFIFYDSKNFRKKHPSIHSYTHKILQFILETMQWKLVRSEFDIFDEQLRLGSSIDIVAVNKKGQIVLIEVKCGYQQTFDNHDGYMHGVLSKLTNSPHHQANLQLITAAVLVIKHHQIPLSNLLLYVIRVDDDDLYYYEINNEYVQKKGAKIYNQLLQDNLNNQKTKKSKIK